MIKIHWTFKDIERKEGWSELVALCKSHKYVVTANRGLNLYRNLFMAPNESFNNHLDNLFKSKDGQNGELTVLDCGSGHGVALKNLLNEFKEFKSATGISMHAFMSVAEDIKAFNGRLDCHFAKAQDVLPSLVSNKYHLITDVYGPYFYSVERPYLLNEYWKLLNPGGCAFIVLGNSLNDTVQCPETKRIDSFIKYLIKTWPDIFIMMKGREPWLLIRKHNANEPAPNLDFKMVKSCHLNIVTKKVPSKIKKDTAYPDHIVWIKMSNEKYIK